jgi:peptide/nickel transport system permease protein
MVEREKSTLDSIGEFIRYHRLATIGGLIVILFLLTGAFAPWLAPKDPNKISIRDSLVPPGTEGFPLGADHAGRDMLSRLIYGARVSLFVSFVAISMATVIGVTAGILAAWYKRLETPIMRLMDVLLCFPGIIIALTIIAVLGTGLENLIIAIAISRIPQFARLVQGLTLSTKQNVYVEAALSMGVSDSRILRKHILPNITAPIVVQISLMIPGAIMTVAGLSFLGLGIAPPTAEWGSMIQDSLKWSRLAPWTMVLPGVALMMVVFGFNTFGDGLRDFMDPRVRKR